MSVTEIDEDTKLTLLYYRALVALTYCTRTLTISPSMCVESGQEEEDPRTG